MKETNIFEILYESREIYSHIWQQIFLHLDPGTLKNLKLISKDMNLFAQRMIWKNSRMKAILTSRLKKRWLTRDDSKESAFQCSDDVYDMKIRGDSIICGLRNGTVEIWNKGTMKKEMEFIEQHGSVQVDANDEVVVGVSSDSTVCVWDRTTRKLKDVFYHHRASVWGVSIRDCWIITGSMDGTISLIDIRTMAIKKHFLAHEGEWGVSDLDTNDEVIVSGCFGRCLKVWSLPQCELIRVIDAKHSVNCVSVCGDVVASCSRTGRQNGAPNLMIWSIKSGNLLQKINVSSACFVKLDCDKLVTLVSAGEGILGEHHLVKWPIAKILILWKPSPKDGWDKWDLKKDSSEILLRYHHTPAVATNRSMLVFSQQRTQGMCSIIDFWN